MRRRRFLQALLGTPIALLIPKSWLPAPAPEVFYQMSLGATRMNEEAVVEFSITHIRAAIMALDEADTPTNGCDFCPAPRA